MAHKIRRKKQKQEAGHRSPVHQPPPTKLLRALEAINTLTRERRWQEALEHLQTLNQRYPNRPEVLVELVDAALALQLLDLYTRYSHDLHHSRPGNGDAHFGAADAYMRSGFFGLALESFQRFLARHPEHGRAREATRMVEELQTIVADLFTNLDLDLDDPTALAARHDEIRFFLQNARFSEAQQVASAVIADYPTFAPAYNNLSQAEALQGNYDKAIALAQQVIAFDPDNFQALANMTRYAYLLGDETLVNAFLAQLREVELPDNQEYQLKVLETLALLGYNDELLATYRIALDAVTETTASELKMMHHFAAVAALQAGDEPAAKAYWQAALALDPNFELAASNLADLSQPMGQRHAPWLYPMNHWIPRQLLDDLVNMANQHNQQDDAASDVKLEKALQRYITAHPALNQILPLLLEKGDPDGREFAVKLIDMARTPNLLEALHDYAQGRHGPDQLRVQAMNIAVDAGLQPHGMAKIWIEGTQSELLMINFDLHGEQLFKHTRAVTAWMNEATQLMYRGDYAAAQALLEQALFAEPQSPDILNNLAALHEKAGEPEKVIEISQRLQDEFPDDFFGQVSRAKSLLLEDKIDEARELLMALATRRRLHFTEFDALCAAQIELMLAQGQSNGAESWFGMWAQINEENPKLAYWREKIDGAK